VCRRVEGGGGVGAEERVDREMGRCIRLTENEDGCVFWCCIVYRTDTKCQTLTSTECVV
jgi:hypothetical protein